MIWVQKNVEVIAQSDNMGLAVWARARVRAGQAGCREHCHAFPESGSELRGAVKGFQLLYAGSLSLSPSHFSIPSFFSYPFN